MAISPDYRTYSGARAAPTEAALDAGLRAYMLRVYNWMASGLVLTGFVAYAIANTALLDAFYPVQETAFGLHRVAGPLAWIAMISPLAFVLVLSFGVNKLSTRTVQALYWAFLPGTLAVTVVGCVVLMLGFGYAGTAAALRAKAAPLLRNE